jgi:hypothetical protein
VQDGTAAPPLSVAQPVREEDRPASRQLIIGRSGIGVSIAAAVIYLLALGSALGGDGQAVHGGWAWGRSSLITCIVVGLVLAGYGYGVDAANLRTDRVAAKVDAAKIAGAETLKAALAAGIEAIEASRADMHSDHAALHRENVALRELLAPLVEAAGRLTAFEERRTLEIAELRKEVKEMRGMLAVMTMESPPARVLRLQPGTGPAKKPRQRGRGGREQRGGDPQETASAMPAVEPAWTPDDVRWQTDVAEAAKLGRQLGPGPEPA